MRLFGHVPVDFGHPSEKEKVRERDRRHKEERRTSATRTWLTDQAGS